MAKPPDNHRKPWSAQDVKGLRELAKENTPTRVMGIKLDRSESSVRSKATAEKISLKPVNQSPNKRRTK